MVEITETGVTPKLKKEKGRAMNNLKKPLSGAIRTPRLRSGVIIGAALSCLIAVSACGINDNRPGFDGHQFRAKLSKVDKQRDQIVVTVSDASKSLVGAREAGRFEATKYCISQFGSSNVAWVNGPDAEDADLVIKDGKLELRGACTS